MNSRAGSRAAISSSRSAGCGSAGGPRLIISRGAGALCRTGRRSMIGARILQGEGGRETTPWPGRIRNISSRLTGSRRTWTTRRCACWSARRSCTATDGGFKAESGRATWAAGHIRGADSPTWTDDLCDRSSPLLYMMPSARADGAVDVATRLWARTRVVPVRPRGEHVGGQRVLWWMLRAVGFDQAAVLSGGCAKWTHEIGPTIDRAVRVSAGALRPAAASPSCSWTSTRCWPASGSAPRASSTALTEERHRGTGGAPTGGPAASPAA